MTPIFDTDDLVFLHCYGIALRHVELQRGLQEARHGGVGDAVSLANYGRSYMRDVNLTFDKPISEEDCKVFQEKLEEFIGSSYQAWHKPPFSDAAFLLMRRGWQARTPYDFVMYPLGKCGKDNFSASQVVFVSRNDQGSSSKEEAVASQVRELKQHITALKLQKLQSLLDSLNGLISATPAEILDIEDFFEKRFYPGLDCAQLSGPQHEALKKALEILIQNYQNNVFINFSVFLEVAALFYKGNEAFDGAMRDVKASLQDLVPQQKIEVSLQRKHTPVSAEDWFNQINIDQTVISAVAAFIAVLMLSPNSDKHAEPANQWNPVLAFIVTLLRLISTSILLLACVALIKRKTARAETPLAPKLESRQAPLESELIFSADGEILTLELENERAVTESDVLAEDNISVDSWGKQGSMSELQLTTQEEDESYDIERWHIPEAVSYSFYIQCLTVIIPTGGIGLVLIIMNICPPVGIALVAVTTAAAVGLATYGLFARQVEERLPQPILEIMYG